MKASQDEADDGKTKEATASILRLPTAPAQSLPTLEPRRSEMNVSIQLTKTARSSNAGKSMILRDIDMDTALAISAALRELQNADVEAVIVVENLPAATRPARPSHKPQRARASMGWAGWLRGLRMPTPAALAR
jgi:hypothetical protein